MTTNSSIQHILLDHSCVPTMIHFRSLRSGGVCCAFSHIANIHQNQNSKLQEYFDNQEYIIPTQTIMKMF
jgi:hypothetical protein